MANYYTKEKKEFEERVVAINRVAKVVKGGRRFSLTALVVVGDGKGKAGYGMGKAKGVPEAIRKAVIKAKKDMVKIPVKGTTIPHQITGIYGAGRVLLKPATTGTGVIAGGPVRAIMDVIGIKDILAKSLGSANPINMVKATFNGLTNLMDIHKVAEYRGLKVVDLLPQKKEEEETKATPKKKAATKEAKEKKETKETEEKKEAKTAAKEKKETKKSKTETAIKEKKSKIEKDEKDEKEETKAKKEKKDEKEDKK